MSEACELGTDIAAGFADKLRDIAAQGHDLNIAQVQFVGLDQMADRFGEEWPAERARALDTAHKFVDLRLEEKDLLLRAADGFILIYADPDAGRAMAHSEKLMAELNAYFLRLAESGPAHSVEVENKQLSAVELLQSVVSMTAGNQTDDPGDLDEAPCGRIEWRYQPVWDVRRQAIAKYIMASYDRESGARIPGYRFEEPSPEFDLAEIDALGLEQSEVALRKMVQSGAKCLLGTSLHFSTMSKPASRNRMFRLLDELDPELARYRVVRLAAVPKGFPRLYMDEIFSGLKGRASKVTVSLAWNEPDFRNILSQSPWAIGVALSSDALKGEAAPSKKELLTQVRKAAEIARGANVQFFFDGPVDRRFVVGLREARVDVVSSEVVWPLLAAPQGPQMWPAQHLAA